MGLDRVRAALSLLPNCCARSRFIKDQVMHSSRPRDVKAARDRRARERRRVSAGAGTVSSLRTEISGRLSIPSMRITSSTKSARPNTPPRQDGTIALPPSKVKPSASKMLRCLSSVTSIPQRVFVYSGSNAMLRSRAGAAPASTISLASPPQISMIIAVASSMPSCVNAASIPRSKR